MNVRSATCCLRAQNGHGVRRQDLLGHKPESRVTQRHNIGAGEWREAVTAVQEVVG